MREFLKRNVISAGIVLSIILIGCIFNAALSVVKAEEEQKSSNHASLDIDNIKIEGTKYGNDFLSGTLNKKKPTKVYEFITSDNTLSYVINGRAFRYWSEDSWEIYSVWVELYDENGKYIDSGYTYDDGSSDDAIMIFFDKIKPGKYYLKISHDFDSDKYWYDDSLSAEGTFEYNLSIKKSNRYGRVKLSEKEIVYDGEGHKLPKITVYDCAGKKIKRSEYEYYYKRDNNKKVKKAKQMGKYNLYVIYKDGYYNYPDGHLEEYYGDESVYIKGAFYVRPPRAGIAKLSSKNGKITVRCKNSRYAVKYRYEIATDKNFKNIVKKGNYGKVCTFSELKKGMTYYVRIKVAHKYKYVEETYTDEKGKRVNSYDEKIVYSKYSNVKKIKCK